MALGSTAVIAEVANLAGVYVIPRVRNLGKDKAVHSGWLCARERKPVALVSMDATAAGAKNGKLTDSLRGYRAFSDRLLLALVPTQNRLSIESQMLPEAQEKDVRIDELNVDFEHDVDLSTLPPGKHGISVIGLGVTIVSEWRSLFFFSVTGLVLLTVAGVLGIIVVRAHFETRHLAIGYSFIVVIPEMVGCRFLVGIVLNVLTSIGRRQAMNRVR